VEYLDLSMICKERDAVPTAFSRSSAGIKRHPCSSFLLSTIESSFKFPGRRVMEISAQVFGRSHALVVMAGSVFRLSSLSGAEHHQSSFHSIW
jgi:hypothetical protein